MANRVEHINSGILKECRLQISLTLKDVEKKVGKIAAMEEGRVQPTFNQLDTLAGLYSVPRWVFLRDTLPEKYRFETKLSGFRQLKGSFLENNPQGINRVKQIVVKVEALRKLFLEIDEDRGEPIPPFASPPMDPENLIQSALAVRDWLEVAPEKNFSFLEWKERLEHKGIFVFITSKYKDWSHLEREYLRGLAIFYETLPIIIINDSDSNKAQTFTLFHELFHILQKQSSADIWEESQRKEETLCDRFAGELLIPASSNISPDTDLDSLKNTATQFKVSPYALLVRERQLGLISQKVYNRLEQELHEEWESIKKQQKERSGGASRNRPQEIVKQYGYYARTLFQAYQEKEINLHKIMSILRLKRASYIFEIQEKL